MHPVAVIKKASANLTRYLYTSVDEGEEKESSKKPKFDVKSGPCHVNFCCGDDPDFDARCGEPSSRYDHLLLNHKLIKEKQTNGIDSPANANESSEVDLIHFLDPDAPNNKSDYTSDKVQSRPENNFDPDFQHPLDKGFAHLYKRIRDLDESLAKSSGDSKIEDDEIYDKEVIEECGPRDVDTRTIRTKPCREELCCAMGHPGCKGKKQNPQENTDINKTLRDEDGKEIKGILKQKNIQLQSNLVNDKIGRLGASDSVSVLDKNSAFKEGRHVKIYFSDENPTDGRERLEQKNVNGEYGAMIPKVNGEYAAMVYGAMIPNESAGNQKDNTEESHVFQKRSREFANLDLNVSAPIYRSQRVNQSNKPGCTKKAKEKARQAAPSSPTQNNCKVTKPRPEVEQECNQIDSDKKQNLKFEIPRPKEQPVTNLPEMHRATRLNNTNQNQALVKPVNTAEINAIPLNVPEMNASLPISKSTKKKCDRPMCKKCPKRSNAIGSKQGEKREYSKKGETANYGEQFMKPDYDEILTMTVQEPRNAHGDIITGMLKNKKVGQKILAKKELFYENTCTDQEECDSVFHEEDEIEEVNKKGEESFWSKTVTKIDAETNTENIREDASIQCDDVKNCDDPTFFKCAPGCLLLPEYIDEECQAELSDDESVCSNNEDFLLQLKGNIIICSI